MTRARRVLPRRMLLAMVLGLVVGAGLAPLPGAVLSVTDYRQQLISLDADLAHQDHAQVLRTAQLLSTSRIAYRDELLEIDPVLLADLDHPAVGRARHQIAVLLTQLATLPAEPPGPDGQALAGIAATQHLTQVARDGDLGGMPLQSPTLPEVVHHALKSILHGIGSGLRAVWHWLRSWFGGESDEAGHGTSHMTLLVILVGAVIAIGFVVLALLSRGHGDLVPTGPGQKQAAARDADPRSRASDEWRDYGDRLAAEGRWREAMRAWYHAVLVQCWSTGTIRHRVGWTNWEYASHLPATWAQRSAFVDLTARFDRHWYGNLGGPDDAEAFKALSLRIAAHLAGL